MPIGNADPNLSWQVFEDTDSAPHEIAAVLRLFRTGKSYPRIAEMLKMSGVNVLSEMRQATVDEFNAKRRSRPICEGIVIPQSPPARYTPTTDGPTKWRRCGRCQYETSCMGIDECPNCGEYL